ncbi:hypothetical protein DPMN_051739 [Dreissena polymorpha]|uniref:Uncharacterized protein n=1 Tax=Dreissena polymorpha TaxID=45954 RepID=A0A9D4CKJ3_DREPO|nr:hypothetical protein DPMN_051739 [Dreissena polymorpha]
MITDCGAVPVIAGVTVTQPATTLVGATTPYTFDAPLTGTGNIQCQATGWTTPAPCGDLFLDIQYVMAVDCNMLVNAVRLY